MHAYLMIVVALTLALASGCRSCKDMTCEHRVSVNCHKEQYSESEYRNGLIERQGVRVVCDEVCRDSPAAKLPLWTPGEAPANEAPCK